MPIDPVPGKTYVVRHTSGLIEARFVREHVYDPPLNPMGGRRRRAIRHYVFQNLTTGREITIKSRARIRREL